MPKSRKNMKSVLNSITTTSQKALPVVNTGLKTVGKAAKESVPIIEKGVSAVYGPMATGFDLGVKGVKTVAKGVKTVAKGVKGSKKRHTRRHKKTRRY
jgi:transposase